MAQNTRFDADNANVFSYGNLTQTTDLSSKPDYAIVGVPFDIRTTYRPGTRFGPKAVREAFCRDSYSEAFGIDTADYVKGIDYGDLPMWNQERAYLGLIPDEIAKISGAGVVPVVIGGDHAIAFPELMGYKQTYGPVSVIHFDSHTDTWGSETDKVHHDHATPFRRAIEYGCMDAEHSIQVGMRGGLRDKSDFDFADSHGLTHVSAVELHHMGMEKAAEMIRAKVEGRKVFVTFDIDFVDPAYAPGTGTPVPGGFTSRETLELLRHTLPGLDIVGFDLVEVAPNYDNAAITAMLASAVIQEFITSLAMRKAGITTYERKGMRLHE